MKYFLLLFIVSNSLFISGCIFDKEEKREAISMGLSPKGMFELAQKNVDGGTIDEAIKIFERIQAAYPSSKYALQSELEIIYNLYKRDRYDEGIDRINDFLKKYPNHFITPYAYYLRGIIAENKSKSILDLFVTDNAQRDVSSVKDAFNYYLDLIRSFPKSQYSEEAKDRLITLRNILARHELFVAIFYTNSSAHVASINRCKYIIEKYPNTPSVPAALHLIAHNYDLIGTPKLAADARRILEASYPKYIPHYNLDD